MRLSAINSTSSAFCAFTLNEDFFEHVRIRGGKEDRDGSRKIECQVNIRSLMASLKTSSTQRNLEKCELIVTEQGQCRIAVRLHYQHGKSARALSTQPSQKESLPMRIFSEPLENTLLCAVRRDKDTQAHVRSSVSSLSLG